MPVLLAQRKDDKPLFQEIRGQINNLLEKKVVTFTDSEGRVNRVEIDYKAVMDLKALYAAVNMAGQNSTHPCFWCELSKEDISNPANCRTLGV